MFHAAVLVKELELEVGTQKNYALAMTHFTEFLARYPLTTTFSKQHTEHLGLLQPAVWKFDEVEAILIDFVLHDVAILGNGWSTVHGKLFGVRHYNVRRNAGNPLLNKLKLQQLMAGLKKYKGPGPGKLAVTMAMMTCIKRGHTMGSGSSSVLFHDAICRILCKARRRDV